MRCSFARMILRMSVAVIVLAALTAQAATVAYWKFDEKAPGNTVDFTTGAILDDTTDHDGTAYGGDPFGTGTVRPIYVNGATGSGDSALQLTLQDWPTDATYVGEEEDVVFVSGSSAFNLDITHSNVYTIEAIVRVPDPMSIMNTALYHDAFPEYYDYTDNSMVGRPGTGTTPVWVFRMDRTGRPAMNLYDGATTVNVASNTPVVGGLWHQVAAQITGSATAADRKVEFFVDGVSAGVSSLSALTSNLSSSSPLMLGSWKDTVGERWSDEFIGDIDSIRISTGAVTMLSVPTQTVPTIDLEHAGMTNPGTETGLKLVDESYLHDPTSTGTAVTGTGGNPDSWRLQEVGHNNYVSSSYAFYRGLLAPEQLQDPNGWTLTATMKLGASNMPYNTCIGVEDGRDAWVMSFMDGTFTQTSGDQGAGVYKSGEYDYTGGAPSAHYTGVVKMGATNPTDGFHTYKMWYDPAGDGGNGIVHFYVDDVEVGTQTRAEAWDTLDGDRGSRSESDCRFWFGDAYPLVDRTEYFPGDTASDAYWANVTMETGGAKEPQYMPYDVNEDGFVGADDLDVVRAHWGESGPGGKAIGDINLDEFVGADDLDQLRAHWGEECPPIPGLVPEPSSIVLLAMGGFLLLIRRIR